MTDKQIVDGVDVSGCEYLNTQNPKLDWSNCGHICKDTECKYKRLWWKKQYIRKEQECEELKKINKANAKSYEKHWYKLEKYKQTLAEIKEFVENEMTPNCDTNIILQKISEVKNEG